MLYVTAEELKLEMPDALPLANTNYDPTLRRLAEQAARWVDRITRRSFWPLNRVLYITRDVESPEMWIPDCLAITKISDSDDDGLTYEEVVATDYLKYGGRRLELNDVPYKKILKSVNADVDTWAVGENSIKVEGIFGWHDDYDNAWETLAITVANDPLTINGTSLSVADADAENSWGLPILQVGQILRIETEYVSVEYIDRVGNTVTIKRAQLGTTAAAHIKTTPLVLYHPPATVQRIVAIQVMRWFKRAQQGWADAGGSAQTGVLVYAQRLDPDIVSMLADAGLRRLVVG